MLKEITKQEFDTLAARHLVETETENGYLHENIIDSDGNEIGFASFNHNDPDCPKYYIHSNE